MQQICRKVHSRYYAQNTYQGITMSLIANTPAPPYYAVIFTSLRTEENNGYAEMATKMVELASSNLDF